MPHWWSDVHGQWRAACDLAGIHFIDPLSGVEAVLNDLRETELLISEALHGAIVADALRTPWVPVTAYKHILAFKWLDWAESVELPYIPHRLEPQYQPEAVRSRLRRLKGWPQAGIGARLAETLVARPAGAVSGAWYRRQVERNARTLQHLAATAAPHLTREPVLDRVVSRLLAALDQFRADLQAGRLVVNSAPAPVVVLTP
jgi:succinoglycan biosynthesis protein ExoV